MLSIAKLRVGQEAYHLSGVAESLDAYYTGSGEAAGQWVGGSTARLGLTGEVSAEDLQAVLASISAVRIPVYHRRLAHASGRTRTDPVPFAHGSGHLRSA